MYNRALLNRLINENKIDGKSQLAYDHMFEEFEQADFPIWKRLKVKDTTVPDYRPYNNLKVLYQKEEGLKIIPRPHQPEEFVGVFSAKAYGPSEKHRLLTEVFANTGSFIEVSDGVVIHEPVILQMAMNEENPLLLDRHTVQVGNNASVTVVMDYSDNGSAVYQNSLVNIIAGSGAHVHVVKIQNLGADSVHIFGAVSILGHDAEVKFNSIDLGGAVTATDYSTYLDGENARGFVDSIYLGDGKAKLDLGYNIYHNGRRTQSDIKVKGALLDEARKVFRGNLYFAKGAKRAQGAEQEFVILLDKRVRADSIPALLCDEDDVQGEHAASAGQVDANKLFYLMSRGLTKKEAKQLIVMASFATVIEQLPIEGLKERIHTIVGEKLTQDL